MAKRITAQVEKLIQPVISGLGYDYVGMELIPQKGNSMLRVYIDKRGGITVDDCEIVSHQVSGVLEVENPIHGQYVLEVSSPGADRILFTKVQYEQFIGKRISLRMTIPLEGRRRFIGVLVSLDDDTVYIEENGIRISVPFAQIDKTRLVPEY